MTATAAKKTAAPRRKPVQAETLAVEIDPLAEATALIASLQAKVEALRLDIVTIGSGMAEQAAANGRDYCEAYENCVVTVSEQLQDEEAKESFKTSATRSYFTFEVTLVRPTEPVKKRVRIRAGTEAQARAMLRRRPWDNVERYEQISLSYPEDEDSIVLIDTQPVRY